MMDFSNLWSGPATPDQSGGGAYTVDWLDVGASTPPPSAQPSFNSPATQDSFSILNTVSTGVDSVSGTLSSIFVASPILLWLGVSKKDLMPVTKENPELARRP